jgi:integral membrane sensor domain MASE1
MFCKTIFVAALMVALSPAAIAQTAPQPKPTYEQLQHHLIVTQELANTYYMRAIQAEAQLTQMRAEQAATEKETAAKAPKK